MCLIVKKASLGLHVLTRCVPPFFNMNILVDLYYSFRLTISYCMTNLGTTYKTHLSPMYILQKRALRLKSRSVPQNSTNLFLVLNILYVYDIAQYQQITLKCSVSDLFFSNNSAFTTPPVSSPQNTHTMVVIPSNTSVLKHRKIQIIMLHSTILQ